MANEKWNQPLICNVVSSDTIDTLNIGNTVAVILWFSVSFVSTTKEEKEVVRLHPVNVICLFTDFYSQTTHILSPMMPETAQTCLEYLCATGQVDKSVVFWNTAWCAAGIALSLWVRAV